MGGLEVRGVLIWIIATFAAFFIKGLCGFANTLVFTSILGFGETNINISPIELLLGYPTNIILTWKNRKQIKGSVCIPLAILVLGGSIPGAILLKNMDTQILKAVFGGVVVVIGIDMLLREYQSSKMKESKIILGLIGIISGLLCGLFGIGALMAAYVGRVTDTTSEFKANISAVFIVENTVRIVLYSILGVLTADTLKRACYLMPIMVIGLLAGMKSAKILNERMIKIMVAVLLIISGIVLVSNHI